MMNMKTMGMKAMPKAPKDMAPKIPKMPTMIAKMMDGDMVRVNTTKRRA